MFDKMEGYQMKLCSEKIKISGDNYTLRLEMPRFYKENTELEHLNSFYGKLVKALEKNASFGGYIIVSELKRAYCSDKMTSIYLDIYWYKDGRLVSCKRISDTRDSEGFELRPPKKIKNKIPKKGGWFYDGNNAVIYKNDFITGEEQKLRRSEYFKLFKEKKINVKLEK